MENNSYKKIVSDHYANVANQHQLSLTSTMPDQNVRRLEIKNIVSNLNDEDNCLEVGCGNGAASVEISKIKRITLNSTDFSQEMIELAKQQSLTGVKGSLKFIHQDILELNESSMYDVVFTIRCIINLLTWDDQKKALRNMIHALKPNGKLILLEAFSDGLGELNQARSEVGLDPIPPAFHNLHLNKEQTIQYLHEENMNFIAENNFLSTYYFGTRVIYPALAKANNVELVRNSKFDSFFTYFPSYGNFSHIKILCFQKLR